MSYHNNKSIDSEARISASSGNPGSIPGTTSFCASHGSIWVLFGPIYVERSIETFHETVWLWVVGARSNRLGKEKADRGLLLLVILRRFSHRMWCWALCSRSNGCSKMGYGGRRYRISLFGLGVADPEDPSLFEQRHLHLHVISRYLSSHANPRLQYRGQHDLRNIGCRGTAKQREGKHCRK